MCSVFISFGNNFTDNFIKKSLAKPCKTTFYNHDSIKPSAIYQIPNNPDREKLKIRISKAENAQNNAKTAATLGFGLWL